jgi:hypothetical protein
MAECSRAVDAPATCAEPYSTDSTRHLALGSTCVGPVALELQPCHRGGLAPGHHPGARDAAAPQHGAEEGHVLLHRRWLLRCWLLHCCWLLRRWPLRSALGLSSPASLLPASCTLRRPSGARGSRLCSCSATLLLLLLLLLRRWHLAPQLRLQPVQRERHRDGVARCPEHPLALPLRHPLQRRDQLGHQRFPVRQGPPPAAGPPVQQRGEEVQVRCEAASRSHGRGQSRRHTPLPPPPLPLPLTATAGPLRRSGAISSAHKQRSAPSSAAGAQPGAARQQGHARRPKQGQRGQRPPHSAAQRLLTRPPLAHLRPTPCPGSCC